MSKAERCVSTASGASNMRALGHALSGPTARCCGRSHENEPSWLQGDVEQSKIVAMVQISPLRHATSAPPPPPGADCPPLRAAGHAVVHR
jgi:hypothetical protein